MLVIATSATAVHKKLAFKKDQPEDFRCKVCRLFRKGFMSPLGLCKVCVNECAVLEITVRRSTATLRVVCALKYLLTDNFVSIWIIGFRSLVKFCKRDFFALKVLNAPNTSYRR